MDLSDNKSSSDEEKVNPALENKEQTKAKLPEIVSPLNSRRVRKEMIE